MTDLNPELLASLDLRVLSIQRTVAGRWWNYRHVVSPFSRLWLVHAGRAVVTHHGRRHVLRPGRVHLIPPFTVHDCRCSGRLDHHHLHFAARLPSGVDLFSLLDVDHDLPAARETAAQFRRLEALYPDRRLPCFDPARPEYRRQAPSVESSGAPGAVGGWEASARLAVLLAPFLASARSHEGPHARVTGRFLAVQEFIHANMHRTLRLADLARAAGWHPTYFSDRFVELVGVRPLEYLLRRRLERAQDLLLTSRAPVKQVAAEVGLPDAAYFTRVFTRRYGAAPSAYRRDHAG